jgi:hypothetical protein
MTDSELNSVRNKLEKVHGVFSDNLWETLVLIASDNAGQCIEDAKLHLTLDQHSVEYAEINDSYMLATLEGFMDSLPV